MKKTVNTLFLFLIPTLLYCQNIKTEYLKVPGLNNTKNYTHVVTVTGNHKTIYISGQVGTNDKGDLVSKHDLKAQAEQAFKNLELALKAAGAQKENIVKWNIYLLAGQDIEAFRTVRAQFWQEAPNPPASTLIYVAGLFHPNCLVEIEAIAVVPQ